MMPDTGDFRSTKTKQNEINIKIKQNKQTTKQAETKEQHENKNPKIEIFLKHEVFFITLYNAHFSS